MIRRIIVWLLLVGVFTGAFWGSYTWFKGGSTGIDDQYLSIFNDIDNRFYLQRAAKDIVIQIETADGETQPLFVLTDALGDEQAAVTRSMSPGQVSILPPQDGYVPGGRYTLVLGVGTHFSDDALRDARVLVFSIERENIEAYVWTSAVKQSTQPIVVTSDSTIQLADSTWVTGDIIYGTSASGETVAYKIVETLADNQARVEIPALDEIFAELDVYGEYTWDVDQLVANPDIEAEIIANVRQSSFFDNLMVEAYAAEIPRAGKLEVKCMPNSATGTIEIEIKITMEPGENGLFGIQELKHQKVTLTLTYTLGLTTRCNIQGPGDWDVSTAFTCGNSWTVDISLYSDEWKTDEDLEDLFDEKNTIENKLDYFKNIRLITEKLNQISSDIAGGELKLFDWKLPIPAVPGLYFSTEIKLFAKLEIAADITFGMSSRTVYTVGACFQDNVFSPYFNTFRDDGDLNVSLRGKANCKAGIKLVFKATLINDKIANINIDPQVGLYADLFITLPILVPDDLSDDNFLYSYFEPGVYFSANLNATINLLVKRFEFSHELVEKKFPFEALTFGNSKIARGLHCNLQSVRAVDNVVALPGIIFDYYDVKKAIADSETLAPAELRFIDASGQELVVRDGNIELPADSSSDSLFVTAAYRHTDGKTYSTVFRVVVSGSLLEGKVSAYAADTSDSELAGAQVDLYAGTGSDTLVSSAMTSEDGKFSFNVAEGSYRLVISAAGYKTLNSYQTVAADEIKYTEHILLMDSQQSGLGTAGGTVTNAMDGRGLNQVRLRLRPDWNNKDGLPIGDFAAYSDAGGHYSIANMPIGYYTVEASLDGFVTGYANLVVLSSDAKSDFDFTITPILSDNEIRIVLIWGDSPPDLDSHLIGRTPAGDAFNVYYSDKVYAFDGIEMANLDVDDTSSYGPETITILNRVFDTYTYAVHDYTSRYSTDSSNLSFSGAVVRVFQGSVQIAEYHVPTDQVGVYWTVFEIGGHGQILPINTISNNKPEP